MKRKLRNQHDRHPRWQVDLLRSLVGNCPHCARFENKLGVKHESVMYRRSEHSITFRCERCKLQWTITLAKLHKAIAAFVPVLKEAGATEAVEVYENFARITKFAAEREAKRKSAINRQTGPRRVIRLPDRV
jgi:hypothetical protein